MLLIDRNIVISCNDHLFLHVNVKNSLNNLLHEISEHYKLVNMSNISLEYLYVQLPVYNYKKNQYRSPTVSYYDSY